MSKKTYVELDVVSHYRKVADEGDNFFYFCVEGWSIFQIFVRDVCDVGYDLREGYARVY